MATSIKLELSGDNSFSREAWYGWGPFTAKVNDDDSLTIQVPENDPQILPLQTNEVGNYWTVNIAGGKAFASVIEHEKYGTYMRLKLGKNVELPASVAEKVNKKPTKSRGPKQTGASGMWRK